jgi:hypothetical protein
MKLAAILLSIAAQFAVALLLIALGALQRFAYVFVFPLEGETVFATNTILTPSEIAGVFLQKLENNMVFGRTINRQYEANFGGKKIGDTITARLPSQWTVRTGLALSPQNDQETSVPIKIDTNKGVDILFSMNELNLSVEEFVQKVQIEDRASDLAAAIEADLASMYADVYNFVGTPGTTPATFLALGAGIKRLNKLGVPASPRQFVVDPDADISMKDALKGVFVSEVAGNAIEDAPWTFPVVGAKPWMSQLIPTHTCGTGTTTGGTPVMNGATLDGATQLVTNGWTAAKTLKKGDVFTVASVYMVNSQTRAKTTDLQPFVATADCVADGAGNMTIPIAPTIKLAGAYQNVDTLPLTAATITPLTGTASVGYAQNLVYHRDAFALVTVNQELPPNVWAAKAVSKSGLSLTIIKQYDINTHTMPCRIDVLYGKKAIQPRSACRISG